MNILIVNHYAGSPEMGMEFRPYYFAKEWIKQGHKVDIIAADYSHLRIKNPKVNKNFQEENIDGINYHWIKTSKYNGNGLKRVISMLQFTLCLIKNTKKILKKLEPDVVICSSTYPFDTYFGQKIKRMSKGKIVYIHEVHDMWPATLVELGGISKTHPFIKIMQRAENSFCKNADHVISMAEYTEEYFIEHGMKKGNSTVIPLGISIDEWKIDKLNEEHQSILENIKNSGKYIVGYFGGHAISNALDIFVKVANEMKEKEDIHFILVGDGVEKNNLINLSKRLELNNIIFLDAVSKLEIPKLLTYFDCIYIGTQRNPLYRFGLCLNKMVDAMLAKKPIICSITAPPTWVEKANAGIVVPSEDVEKICEAILNCKLLLQDEIEAMGKRGENFVKEELNIKTLSHRVIDIVKNVQGE